MILSAIITLLLTGLLICARKRETESDEEWNQTKLPVLFLKAGQMLTHFVLRLLGKKEESVLPEKRKEIARGIGLAILVMLVGAVLSVLYALSSKGAEQLFSIDRPPFGEEKQVSFHVKENGKDCGEIRIPISGSFPADEEWDHVFNETFEAMKPVWLSGNASFDEVRSNLSFPDEADNGIEIRYQSGNLNFLSNWGVILSDDIPRDGENVLLTVHLSYAEKEKAFEIPLRILPEQALEKDFAKRLSDFLKKIDQDTRKQKDLVLPKFFEGNEISFESNGISPYLFLGISVILAVCMFFLPGQKKKEKEKKRSEELEKDYPAMLTKLRTLINAGMSTRNAWYKISDHYEKEVRTNRKMKKAVYEEMLITAKELQTGITEENAYLRFGRRCGLRCYIKFGNLLSQNMRQGISGLEKALREEAEQALEEQRTRVLRMGEKAKTKQLFPMLLMLGIVIVMLIAPTLMSF